jgi:hypothetical protein
MPSALRHGVLSENLCAVPAVPQWCDGAPATRLDQFPDHSTSRVDAWGESSWCRYADDGLVHCKTKSEAQHIRQKLESRFIECGLEMHPDKTKIVYCKDSNRISNHINTSFDFLGFTFRPREAKNRRNGLRFTSFTPAVSKIAMKSMRAKIKKCRLGRRTELSIHDIVEKCNPYLRGWVNYYGQYHITEMESVFRHFNQSLVKWAMRKYTKLNKTQAIEFLSNLAKEKPRLFVHWDRGRPGAFA